MEKTPKQASVVMLINVPRGKQAKTIIKSIAKYFDIKGTVQRINVYQVKIVFESNHHINLGLFTSEVYFKFKQFNLVDFYFEEKKYLTSFDILKANTYVVESSNRNSSDDDSKIPKISVQFSKDEAITWNLVKAFVEKCTLLTAISESSENISESENQEIGKLQFLDSLKQASEIIEKKKLKRSKKHHELDKPISAKKNLERIEGSLIIGSHVLNKNNPKSWSPEQVKVVLLDTKLGVGLDEEEFQNLKLKGRDLYYIVDALISFNGDKEAKINYAFSQPLGIECPKIKNIIVRWVFDNLLEYK